MKTGMPFLVLFAFGLLGISCTKNEIDVIPFSLYQGHVQSGDSTINDFSVVFTGNTDTKGHFSENIFLKSTEVIAMRLGAEDKWELRIQARLPGELGLGHFEVVSDSSSYYSDQAAVYQVSEGELSIIGGGGKKEINGVKHYLISGRYEITAHSAGEPPLQIMVEFENARVKIE